MLSLEINPNVGGTEAIAAHAITVDVNVNGNCRHELPNRSISRVCTNAAANANGVPTPIVATIHPKCDTVE